jgi:hypothetical protein
MFKKLILAFLFLFISHASWAQALDGSNSSTSITGTSATITLSTTHSPDPVCVFFTTATTTDITGVASPTIGAFTEIGHLNVIGNVYREVWCGTANSNLSSEVITVTLGATATFWNLIVWGISGAINPTTFDPHAGLPYQGTAPVVSTTHANDFIFAGINCGGSAVPTAGSGWTAVQPGNYNFMEYQIVSSPQTSLSVTTAGTGGGACGTTNTIAHAIELSGGAVTPENILMGVQ